MNEKDILKALECCTAYGWFTCTHCSQKCLKTCKGVNPKATLDLIRRQQTEIERLNTNMDSMVTEHERLINNAKSEAIKEFAKELIINLDGDIEAYANAGHGLNVYEWLVSYMNSKGAIENEHREQ